MVETRSSSSVPPPAHTPDSTQTLPSSQDQLTAFLLEKARWDAAKAKSDAEKAEMDLINARKGSNPRVVGDDDVEDNEGEVPQEIKPIAARFAGLPPGQIVKIYNNRFRPMDLYRLYRGRGFRHDRDDKVTMVVNGSLQMKKVGVAYKDYGSSFYDVWSEAFTYYARVVAALFGKTSPDLFDALLGFRTKIHGLAKIYEWQNAVLPLAIDAHTAVLASHPTEAASWVVEPNLKAFYCIPLTVLAKRVEHSSLAIRDRRRSRSPRSRSAVPNDSSVICDNFNKGQCKYPRCERAHKCKKCGATGHGEKTCKKV